MREYKKFHYGSENWFNAEYAKYDDDPWGLSWRPSQKVRYSRVLNLLDNIPKTPLRILDVGCATGDFTSLLASKYGRIDSVTGIDFVESAIHRAKDKYPKLDFRVASIFDIGRDFNGEMDLITCLEVLYYLERKDCSRALISIKEALRPGGYVLFSSMISKKPYFSLQELKYLVSKEFIVIDEKVVHIKFLSFCERAMGKLEGIGKKIILPEKSQFVPTLFSVIPFRYADFFEMACRYTGNLLASHALVLGKVSR